MGQVRIFSPAKTAMQSGRGKGKNWILEFEPNTASLPDDLMGWSGAGDTSCQVRLTFNSMDEAINYAEKNKLLYTIEKKKTRKITPKSYGYNFDSGRKIPWTH